MQTSYKEKLICLSHVLEEKPYAIKQFNRPNLTENFLLTTAGLRGLGINKKESRYLSGLMNLAPELCIKGIIDNFFDEINENKNNLDDLGYTGVRIEKEWTDSGLHIEAEGCLWSGCVSGGLDIPVPDWLIDGWRFVKNFGSWIKSRSEWLYNKLIGAMGGAYEFLWNILEFVLTKVGMSKDRVKQIRNILETIVTAVGQIGWELLVFPIKLIIDLVQNIVKEVKKSSGIGSGAVAVLNGILITISKAVLTAPGTPQLLEFVARFSGEDPGKVRPLLEKLADKDPGFGLNVLVFGVGLVFGGEAKALAKPFEFASDVMNLVRTPIREFMKELYGVSEITIKIFNGLYSIVVSTLNKAGSIIGAVTNLPEILDDVVNGIKNLGIGDSKAKEYADKLITGLMKLRFGVVVDVFKSIFGVASKLDLDVLDAAVVKLEATAKAINIDNAIVIFRSKLEERLAAGKQLTADFVTMALREATDLEKQGPEAFKQAQQKLEARRQKLSAEAETIWKELPKEKKKEMMSEVRKQSSGLISNLPKTTEVPKQEKVVTDVSETIKEEPIKKKEEKKKTTIIKTPIETKKSFATASVGILLGVGFLGVALSRR